MEKLEVGKLRVINPPQTSFIAKSRMVKEEGLRLITNREASDLFEELIPTEKGVKGVIGDEILVITGTMAVYAESDKRLGALIKNFHFNDETWMFPVPHEFRNLKNAALTIEHPYWELEESKGRVILHAPSRRIHVVENIVRYREGSARRFKTDERTAIPLQVEDESGVHAHRDRACVGPLEHIIGVFPYQGKHFTSMMFVPSVHPVLAVPL